MSSMTSTRQERIAYLQEKGPEVSLFDDNREISIVLLRDGKEEHHTFFRNTIVIVFPQMCRSTPDIPNDAPDYFIYAPTPCAGMNAEIIPLTKDEADAIAYKMYQLNSAADAEAAQEEADDNECGYYEHDDEDDDRASVTSTEVRLHKRIIAEEMAKMSNEIEQEKQAVQNEWADARQRILAAHEARMAKDAEKQLAERMRIQAAIIEEYGSEKEFLKSRAAGEEALRLIHTADRMRMATEGYKY